MILSISEAFVSQSNADNKRCNLSRRTYTMNKLLNYIIKIRRLVKYFTEEKIIYSKNLFSRLRVYAFAFCPVVSMKIMSYYSLPHLETISSLIKVKSFFEEIAVYYDNDEDRYGRRIDFAASRCRKIARSRGYRFRNISSSLKFNLYWTLPRESPIPFL